MKKSLTLLAFALGMSCAYGQDLTSKKGEPILPEAGDWGLGVDATPFLDYMGNFFGKTTSNAAPTFNFLAYNTQMITYRYFQDANTVYRGALRIGLGGPTVREQEVDRSYTAPTLTNNGYPDPKPALVENEWKNRTTTIGLSGGIEIRKGKTRLQGYYGGEVGIFFSSSRDKFTYGNNLAVNVTPGGPGTPQDVTPDNDDAITGANNVTSASGLGISGANGNGLARVTERKNGAIFEVGLRGFIGCEYFLLPKISLGGEFGWGLGLATQGAGKTTYESTGNKNAASTANDDTIGTTEIKGAKQGSFTIDTDNKNSMWAPAGTIRLNFYF
ncbi:MAG TPA: hypothetical protein PLQ93_12780 [Bacteroidia bacterium]|nr:hypothetical protein [Bacteroidia bacterium]